MADLKIDMAGCGNAEIADQLRGYLRAYERHPLKTWRWWSGFLWGAIFMSLLNVGDVHICAGECDGEGFRLLSQEWKGSADG